MLPFSVFVQRRKLEDEKWAGQHDGGGGAERRRQPGVQRHRGGDSSRGERTSKLLGFLYKSVAFKLKHFKCFKNLKHSNSYCQQSCPKKTNKIYFFLQGDHFLSLFLNILDQYFLSGSV